VLVVDDDEFNRLIVRRYLGPPVVVDAAVNGRAAVEAAALAPPDVILMDLDMPIMDGYDAVARIRGDEAQTGRKRAVVIALSSHDDDQVRARCLSLGFDFYLTKPVTRELLHETIARLCGKPAPAQPASQDDELKALLPGFIASRRELANQMQQALATGDREELRRTAHKLAGSFALYGFDWAANHCRSLERDAPAGEIERLGEMITSLRDHLDEVKV